MKHGSLFSGIGGFDLAAEWMGWENMFHCEWNEFGQKILKYYWPKAISYGDITKTDFNVWRGRIDILTGGFPCQPYSMAGKRKGTEDERHLWPEMCRVIREVRPTWVVGENVHGIVSWDGGLVFEQVQSDLEAEGYEVQPYILPACAVNAPHRRDRVWFIAYNNGTRTREQANDISERELEKKIGEIRFRNVSNAESYSRSSSNANHNGCHECDSEHEVNSGEGGEYALDDISADAITNTRLLGQTKCQKQTTGTKQCNEGDVANASNQGLQGSKVRGSIKREWKERDKQLAGCFCTGWQNFPTQSPLCSRDDGISSKLDGITFPKWRNESIKAYGNAIVPQVALQIFKAIEQYNES